MFSLVKTALIVLVASSALVSAYPNGDKDKTTPAPPPPSPPKTICSTKLVSQYSTGYKTKTDVVTKTIHVPVTKTDYIPSTSVFTKVVTTTGVSESVCPETKTEEITVTKPVIITTYTTEVVKTQKVYTTTKTVKTTGLSTSTGSVVTKVPTTSVGKTQTVSLSTSLETKPYTTCIVSTATECATKKDY